MTKISVASTATSTIPVLTPAAPATVRALNTITGLVEIAGTWHHLLRTTIFPEAIITDGKNRVAFQKRLMTEKARSILMIVWKESAHVRDADVDAAGLERMGSPCTPINCHNLAKKLAADASDVDRQEKQIQGIVEAAEGYGLLAREQFNGTRQRALRGTAKLNDLMLAIDAAVRPIFSDIVSSGLGGV